MFRGLQNGLTFGCIVVLHISCLTRYARQETWQAGNRLVPAHLPLNVARNARAAVVRRALVKKRATFKRPATWADVVFRRPATVPRKRTAFTVRRLGSLRRSSPRPGTPSST